MKLSTKTPRIEVVDALRGFAVMAPYCGYTLSLIIGIILFLLQVQFCKWWLSKHKQGPLETIWHKWTWIGTKK